MKDVKLRLLDTTKVKEEKAKWQFINIVIPILFLILFAFLFTYLRKKRFT
jgi:ABC-2 type transport system permease protein